MKNSTRTLFGILSIMIAIGAIAQNDITLNLNLDQYGDETTWELTDLSNMSVIGSGGPYTQQAGSGVYPEPPTPFSNLSDGNYRFSIFDSFGDGICCGFGSGFYELVEDATMNIIAMGSSFGDDEITDFVLPLPPPPPVGVATPLSIVIEEWCAGPTGNGFNNPVEISNANDGRIFIVEQDGVIWVADSLGQVNATPFLDIDGIVNSGGNEQGLLGLAFHSNYDQNGFFYVNYTSSVGGGNGGTSRVSRFSVSADPDIADANSELIIYTVSQHSSNHNGGEIVFGPDGYLYLGFGDGGGANDIDNWSQNRQSALGKMIRIDVDNGSPYSVPADNPFLADTNTLDEIWAIGLRNPWRYSFDADNGDLWIGDVGQSDVEEVCVQLANSAGGENYGWRCYEGNTPFNTSGCGSASDYVFPVSEHFHSDGWCSITGGFVYRGATYPLIYGHYIYVDYCAGEFFALEPDSSGGYTRGNVLNSGQFGFSSFGEDMYNEMYVANRNDGIIYKITEPCSGSIPVINYIGSTLTSTSGVEYYWYLDRMIISGATSQSYDPVAIGEYYVVVDDGNGCLVMSNVIDVTVVGIEENIITGLQLIPNPANDRFNVLASSINGEVVVQITDMMGRTIWDIDLGVIAGAMNRSFDISRFDPGVYLVNIIAEGHSNIQRLAINR